MSRRHADVDDYEIGPVLANELQQLRAIAGLTNQLVPGPLEQARKAFSQEHIVVRKDNDPKRDMDQKQIVRAIRNFVSSGMRVEDGIHVLNFYC